MKLAFNGQAHYANFDASYELYKRRSKTGQIVDEATYKKLIKSYCHSLAEKLAENGIVDLPKEMGSIATAVITRKPQYRNNKFIGYGGIDRATGKYDGKLKTFGIVFLPGHGKNGNLRSFGFVANKQLFRKLKKIYESEECGWQPIEFKDELI